MNNQGMFKTKCAYCGKDGLYVYAKDKMGTLPPAYCDKVCRGNAKDEKRFK